MIKHMSKVTRPPSSRYQPWVVCNQTVKSSTNKKESCHWVIPQSFISDLLAPENFAVAFLLLISPCFMGRTSARCGKVSPPVHHNNFFSISDPTPEVQHKHQLCHISVISTSIGSGRSNRRKAARFEHSRQ
jgi:hypothetical protein